MRRANPVVLLSVRSGPLTDLARQLPGRKTVAMAYCLDDLRPLESRKRAARHVETSKESEFVPQSSGWQATRTPAAGEHLSGHEGPIGRAMIRECPHLSRALRLQRSMQIYIEAGISRFCRLETGGGRARDVNHSRGGNCQRPKLARRMSHRSAFPAGVKRPVSIQSAGIKS